VGSLTLIVGPARSGKSRLAERLAREHGGSVVFLATLAPADAEMARRVDAHRARRPAAWRTVEETLRVTDALAHAQPYDVALLDCATLWLSNLLLASGEPATTAAYEEAVAGTLAAVDALVGWQQAAPSDLIVVTNEVGAGVVPATPLGRHYRDALGRANQALAAAADRLYSVVAGYYLDVKALGARPV
jgi:adenosylcobinamide kinase/adenosylcobinamide-phosphate guanylyltransferase